MRDYTEFVASMVDGKVPAASVAELRALLHWLAGRRNEAAVSIETAFNARGISPDSARRHTRRYLDNNLFRHRDDHYRLFGLTPDSTFAEIRARHKQLLQIFHPDRHTEDRDWFTERTEQLNQAYAYLSAHHGKTQSENAPVADSIKRPPTAAPEPHVAASSKPDLLKTLAASKGGLRRKLRTYLGSSASFERRLYIILGSIPALLFLLVYLYESQKAESQEHASVAGVRESIGESISLGSPDKAPDSPEGPDVAVPNIDDLDHSPGQTGRHEDRPGVMRDRASRLLRSNNGQIAARDNATILSLSLVSSKLSVPSMPDSPYPRESPSSPRSPEGLHPPEVTLSGSREADSRVASKSQTEDDKSTLRKDPDQEHGRVAAIERQDDAWIYIEKEINKTQRSQQSSSNRSTRTLPDHTDVNDLIAVKKLLSQYEIAYNFSNINRLSRLFHPEAVTKYGKGKPEIEENYLMFFHRTSRRKLVIGDARIERLDDRHFSVTAEYFVDWTLTNGKSNTENGLLRMQLVKLDDKVKIRRLNYVVQ